MKKAEIVEGGHYRAMVSGNLVTVKVIEITKMEKTKYTKGGNSYYVENLKTSRFCYFKSAARFRSKAVYEKHY